MARKKRIKIGGLGDDIATVIEATGIKKLVEIFVDGKDCGCDKRKEQINKIFPKVYKVRCMTETEYNDWKAFKEVRTLRLEWDQILFVCKMYSDIFNKPFWKPECINCGGTAQALIKMIDMIDKVHDTYENN